MKGRRIILTNFVKQRMAHFGFDEGRTKVMVNNGKPMESVGEVMQGYLKKDASYIVNGPYFFQVVNKGGLQIVIAVNVVVFTNHAHERMRSFNLSEMDVVNYLKEAIEMPEAMLGSARRNYKNPENKDKTYKYGPFVFGITEKLADWVVVTVFDQRITLPDYDPLADPMYKTQKRAREN